MIDAIDLRGEFLVAGAQFGLRGGGIGANAFGIAGFRRAVDLRAQRSETCVAVRQRRRHLPHLLRRRGVLSVRQHAYTGAQRDEAEADPLGPRRHGLQQVARAFTLVLLLQCAAIEQRAAHDPAVVGGNQELLDQQLGVGVGEIGRGHGLRRIDAGQQRRDLVALRPQLLGAVAPLAVLDAAAALGARVLGRREHRAVLAVPLDAGERAARGFLHLHDPLAVLRP